MQSLLITFLNNPELICLRTVKWFLNIAIYCSPLLNGIKYFYLTLIILFNTILLFAHSKIVPSIAM